MLINNNEYDDVEVLNVINLYLCKGNYKKLISIHFDIDKKEVDKILKILNIKKDYTKVIEKRQKTMLEKYGQLANGKKISETWQSKSQEEINKRTQKSKQTKFERYGDEIYHNVEQMKETQIKKYGSLGFNTQKQKETNLSKYGFVSPANNVLVKNKTKENNLKKYGIEFIFQLTEFKEKAKQTKLEKYNDENYNNREKAKETCFINHGVKIPIQNKNILDKIKKVKLHKYGYSTFNLIKAKQTKISYCDYSKFEGTVYERLGFMFKELTKPTIIWSKKKEKITQNLLNQRGADQLLDTNDGKGTSNKDIMIREGWVEIYDCGQKVFEYIL